MANAGVSPDGQSDELRLNQDRREDDRQPVGALQEVDQCVAEMSQGAGGNRA